MQSKVAFLTLGCKVNSYETKAMQQLFLNENYIITSFEEEADIYIVNTCTVTNIADRKSRQMLHKAKKTSPNAIVVAVGCYVQAAKEEIENDSAIDIVVGNNQKKDIIYLIQSYLENNKQLGSILDIGKETDYESLTIQNMDEKTRAYIKIQDGCNQFCSYCIIPYARGRVRSRKPEEIYTEVEQLSKNGYKEIVLTGIHLSSYGMDFDDIDIYEDIQNPGTHLLNLIKEISKQEEIQRIRLGSLEPRIITEEFVSTLALNPKICPHFHLSLQSGCDVTLKRMNRHYTKGEYYNKCALLREYFTDAAITTDIIVGFPGETEEEFEETCNFIKKISFYQMHIFQYSKRKGTKAAVMDYQVNKDIMRKRSNYLSNINKLNKDEFLQKFLNKDEKVLIEETIALNNQTYQVGYTKRYVKVAVSSKESLQNKIIKVRIIKQLNEDLLLGELQYNR